MPPVETSDRDLRCPACRARQRRQQQCRRCRADLTLLVGVMDRARWLEDRYQQAVQHQQSEQATAVLSELEFLDPTAAQRLIV